MCYRKEYIHFSSVAVTCIIGLIASDNPVGIGTITGMIGVGRYIAAFNYLCHRKMMIAIGRTGGMQMSL